MSHIFLVGFMGAGKSTVGRLVADRLGVRFVDLDDLIEQAEGRSVSAIFAEEGEPAFRAKETQALLALEPEPPAVVACGGGVVLADENRAALSQRGRVVYLQVSAGEALARVGDSSTRPLLAGGGGAMAGSLLAAREALYRSTADFIVSTEGRTPQQVSDDIVRLVEGVR